jgi:TetR/AcrR family acrAB operon transcriptional repressor
MARKTKAEAELTRQQIIDAARRVFYRCGVTRSTLEGIATEAGVTRGAVYWHFKNKIELFFAMRAQAFLPLLDHIDDAILDESIADPLDGIELALKQMMASIRKDNVAAEVYRIAALRCEYVDELAPILEEFKKSHSLRIDKMTLAYRRAAAKGTLRNGLDPRAMALDTMSFFEGLLRRVALEAGKGIITSNINSMIRAHIALRRKQS